jgi:hypothetical protein
MKGILPIGALPLGGALTEEHALTAAHQAALMGYGAAELEIAGTKVLVLAKLRAALPPVASSARANPLPPRPALFGRHERDTARP